jgi:hypothetical protein
MKRSFRIAFHSCASFRAQLPNETSRSMEYSVLSSYLYLTTHVEDQVASGGIRARLIFASELFIEISTLPTHCMPHVVGLVSVGILIRLRAGRSRNQGFSTTFRLSLELTQPPAQRVPGWNPRDKAAGAWS